MATIHPSSVVDASAKLGDDVQVGPLCYVGPGVSIGQGTRLVSHVSVLGPTTLGCHNEVWPQVTLGAAPQDAKYKGEPTQLVVGDHNIIRECVTVHRGTAHDQSITRIGSHNLLMAYVHIAHDCVIGDHNILANDVGLSGHVCMEDHVIIGGQCGVHHFVTFGQFAYVGGQSRVLHDVLPFMRSEGSPARARGVNSIGLTRNGFSDQTSKNLRSAYKLLFGKADQSGVGNTQASLEKLQSQFVDDPQIQYLIRFMNNSAKSTYGRYRESFRTDDRRQVVTKPGEAGGV